VALLLLLLLVGAVLAGLLYVGALIFQGVFYTEPSTQLSWGAPAAAGVITLFLGLWCALDANNRGATSQDLPYDTLFRFSPEEEMTPGPVEQLWAVRKDSKDPVEYKRRKYAVGGISHVEYVEAARPDHRWNSSAVVDAILIRIDGQEYRFVPKQTREGGYRQFVDADGWVMREYDPGGPTGQPTKFRSGRFLANLLLNSLHLGLWFGCLWLLLRFQWAHALGLGLILWLVMTLTFLPMLLTQAAALAWQEPSV